MGKLSKKQGSQAVIIVILAGGLLGYIAYPMLAPKQPAPPRSSPVAKPIASTAPAAQSANGDGGSPDVPPPGPGLRDPFIPGVVDPATIPASQTPPPNQRPLTSMRLAPLIIPHAPPLPAQPEGAVSIAEEKPPGPLVGLRPLDVKPAAPQWTVSGVINSGAGSIAILRNGDMHRIVSQGETLDGQYVVSSITRTSVVLRRGREVFTLPLSAPPKAADAGTGKDVKTNAPADKNEAVPNETH